MLVYDRSDYRRMYDFNWGSLAQIAGNVAGELVGGDWGTVIKGLGAVGGSLLGEPAPQPAPATTSAPAKTTTATAETHEEESEKETSIWESLLNTGLSVGASLLNERNARKKAEAEAAAKMAAEAAAREREAAAQKPSPRKVEAKVISSVPANTSFSGLPKILQPFAETFFPQKISTTTAPGTPVPTTRQLTPAAEAAALETANTRAMTIETLREYVARDLGRRLYMPNYKAQEIAEYLTMIRELQTQDQVIGEISAQQDIIYDRTLVRTS